MRAVLSGGGTAGHINPAIFIAKKILEKEPDSQILFVGTPNGMENRLVGKAGFEIRHVGVMGLRRKLTLENVKAAYLAVTSIGKAKKILRDFRPDVVIGTGGYVSWPVVRAAASMKIPTLIHEANAFPGLTTRKLAGVADSVCLSFDASRSYFQGKEKKLALTGNPTAPELETISAGAINEAVFQVAKNYSCKKPIFHTHAFGVREYDHWMNLEKSEGICRFGNVKFSDYIYDMPKQMMAADLVISRAGAITLAELSCLGKPAILIPSPNVTDNHQYKNALVFAESGAAVLIEEKDLTPERLTKEIDALLTSPEKLAKMSENMKKLAHTGASDKIWDEICKIRK